MTKTVCIATNNADKAREIAQIISLPTWEFKTLRDLGIASDPDETGSTYAENARIKARAAHEASGHMAVLADDSGLSVDALDGAPGIYSARFAGGHDDDAANNAKLFEALADVPDDRRSARFVCSLCFIDEDGTELTAEGIVEGFIAHKCKGQNGFGYDPLFLPCAYQGTCTMAELSAEQKDAISHRGNALRQLAVLLQQNQR